MKAALSMVAFLGLMASMRNAQGGPRLRVVPQLGVGSGYDTNAYLDAAAFPATLGGTEAGGPLLELSPGVAISWRPGHGHHLFFSYEGHVDQFLGGEIDRETFFRHGGVVAYLPPQFWGFAIQVQAGFEHFVFRHYALGWIQGFARLGVAHALPFHLRLSVAYLLGHVLYDDDGDVSSASSVQDEWTHGVEAAFEVRPWPWLRADVRYSLVRTLATPRATVDEQTGELIVPPSDAFDGWRHGVALQVEITPHLPVSLTLAYRLWFVDFDRRFGPKDISQHGPPPTVPTESRLNELSARIRWRATETVAVQLRYAAFFGFTDYYGPSGDPRSGPVASESTSQRHQLLLGLLLHWDLGLGRVTRQRHVSSSRLRLRLILPKAKEVSVIGTFNGWSRQAGRLRRDRRGRWVGSFALPPGEHRYTLWIDGTIRPPDDCAMLIPDGFGGQNCAIRRDEPK